MRVEALTVEGMGVVIVEDMLVVGDGWLREMDVDIYEVWSGVS